MTREEAIKTLYELWRETNDTWYEEVYNMAIEALSAPQTDLISRADAIEVVLTYFVPRSHTGERGEHEEDFVRTIFNALPSANYITEKPNDAVKASNDVINRADAIEAVAIAICKDYDEIDALKALPSAEAVQGEWIKKQVFNPELDKYVPFIECSVCGYEPYFGGSESKFNYCQNCGAKMKGGEDK